MTRNRNVSKRVNFALLCTITTAMLLWGLPAAAQEPEKQATLVDEALVTLNNFTSDPDMTWFRQHVKDAKGLMIVPELIKAGFVFGGSGGTGVLLLRDQTSGEWSQPAFYSIGSVSVGFQVGVKASEVIMLVMSPKGIDPLFSPSFKLGGEASVAAGPVGAGAEGATATNMSADYLAFARSKGAFVGLSLEGAFVDIKGEWNSDYYGKPVEPVNILVNGTVSNPQSDRLRRAVMEAAK